jgi:hypothetical protein
VVGKEGGGGSGIPSWLCVEMCVLTSSRRLRWEVKTEDESSVELSRPSRWESAQMLAGFGVIAGVVAENERRWDRGSDVVLSSCQWSFAASNHSALWLGWSSS